jgi:CBS domain-containing protein
MRIKDIMSQPTVTCPTSAALDAAARLMWEFDCGMIPIVGDDGRLAGLVTDRDICLAAYMHRKPLHLIPVTKVMVKQVITTDADDTVESAEHLMRDNHIRRLPVIDREGRPAGVVSIDDLAKLAARDKKGAVDPELIETLAAVSRPRTAPAPDHGPLVAKSKAHA